MTVSEARLVKLKFGDETSLQACRIIDQAEYLKRGQEYCDTVGENYTEHDRIEHMDCEQLTARIEKLMAQGLWKWDHEGDLDECN